MKLIISLFTAFLGLASISSADNIVETAEAAGTFTSLVTALDVAGLDSVLEGDGPYTVFAPTDEAFGSITAEQLVSLQPYLQLILQGHVVSGNVSSAMVLAGSVPGETTTLGNTPITIAVASDGTTITVSDGTTNASVITPDIVTDNGIIHAIDQVLIPESVRLAIAGGSAAPDGTGVPASGAPVGTVTPVIASMAPGDVTMAPGDVTMAPGDVTMAPGDETMGPTDTSEDDSPTEAPAFASSGGGSVSGTTEAPASSSPSMTDRMKGHLFASAILFFAGLTVM